jgi:drug/metabolite transporter (DMT)-like permease
MVRAGILLALVGVLIAGLGTLLYTRLLVVPELTQQLVQSVTWISWALGGVFVISGAGAVISNRNRRRDAG